MGYPGFLGKNSLTAIAKKVKYEYQPPSLGQCRNPGLNQGPLDLQSNALPTELFRPTNVAKRSDGSVH